MHDPKFEKEVQKKMEELEFSPSERVWTRLEQELHKETRRTLPLFWLMLLAGGILIGAAGTWLLVGRSAHTRPEPVGQTSVSLPNASSASPAVPSVSLPDAPSVSSHPLPPSPPAAAPPAAAPHVASSRAASSAPPLSSSSMPHTAAAPPESSVPDNAEHEPETSGIDPRIVAGQSTEAASDGDELAARSAVRIALAALGSDLSRDHLIATPVTDASLRARAATNRPAANPTAANRRAAKKIDTYERPSWEAGFTGGIGVSSVARSLVKSGSTLLNDIGYTYFNPSPTSLNTVTAAPSYEPYISKISPDLSFWAGVFVRKPIGSRVSLSAGLNLQYYSMRLSTGQKISYNPAASTPSLFYSSVIASSRSYPYYLPGNNSDYLNRYYFLELPVSLQWQFKRSTKLPLFFEGGISAARLMSVNALYFDGYSGVYYKYSTPSSDALQLFTSASLMTSLHWGSARIQVGPQVQYGLSNLSRDNYSSPQHVIYGGLKITVMPGRR